MFMFQMKKEDVKMPISANQGRINALPVMKIGKYVKNAQMDLSLMKTVDAPIPIIVKYQKKDDVSNAKITIF